jgi:hypothetical protein
MGCEVIGVLALAMVGLAAAVVAILVGILRMVR